MSINIIVTGLAKVGKSSFINYLAKDSFEIKLNKLDTSIDFCKLNDEVNVFSMSGERFFTDLCNKIVQGVDGVVIMIDSTDYKNIETNMQLAQYLSSLNIPLVIFANKIDLPTSYPLSNIEAMCNVYGEMHSGCAKTGDGVKESLYELLTSINSLGNYNRPEITEDGPLAADGGKSEMLDVFEYFHGYLEELQNYVVSRSYDPQNNRSNMKSIDKSQVLFT